MRKSFLSKRIAAVALGSVSLFFTACATDTHYDSLMTTLSFDVPAEVYQPADDLGNPQGATVSVYQRIAFDRDMWQVSDFRLHDAWLTVPTEDGLSLLKKGGVYIYEDADVDKERIYWLTTVSQLTRNDVARMLELDIGNLLSYLRENAIIIRIDLELEPYPALRYKMNHCTNSERCPIDVDLSLTFEVTD